MTLAPLSAEQAEIFTYLESTEDHVYVTGKAGAGKTHVLRWFRQHSRKNVAVCAPTGIAALNSDGATIHNLIGLGTGLPADLGVDMYKVRSARQHLRELDTLVIDEISMVSSDLMDSIDRNLQGIRGNRDAFGGLQVIMFGDVYQLPPVVSKEDMQYYHREGYRSEWFFDAEVWKYAPFHTFQLQEIHRQADPVFIRLLNGVRDGTISNDDLNLLNMLGRRPGKTDNALLLGSRRDAVSSFNSKNLAKIRGKRDTYDARVNTGFGRTEPADRQLHLKPKSHIMMLSNDREDRWVNGTQGIVENCGPEFIQVTLHDLRLKDDVTHTVERFSWVKAGTPPDEYAAAPKFTQFPIRLAWAVTIHKSQGLSLPEIEIDLGSGAFSPGQTYVALSRVTTPEGLYLTNPIQRSDIKVDHNVRRFFDDLAAKR